MFTSANAPPMPEINIFTQSSSPDVIIAQVSASDSELKSWAQKQTRFPSRDIASLSNHRQLEHLAVDKAMLELSAPWSTAQIAHDENGKPALLAIDKFISISHHAQGTLCSVIICLGNHAVGCDIERPRAQLHAISKRFLSQQEQNHFTTTPLLCCAWGIKESMFKTIGHGIDFRIDLIVNAIPSSVENPFEATGSIKGEPTQWRIWKVQFHNAKDKDADDLYAIAGPV